MEKARVAILAVVAALLAAGGGGEAAVYTVGDSAGWTIRNMPNYTAWALSKSFHVGDTIVFTYNKEFHNALEVNEIDYMNCSAASPIATYTSGDDSVVLNRSGHFYFLCGFPGHCLGGQKVDVNVAASSAAPSESPSSSSAASPSPSQGSGAAAGAGAVHKALTFAAAVVSFATLCGGGLLMH